MIQAKFHCGDSIRMELSGHAGAARKGHDLVCAAVSGLACTLAAAVERMDGLLEQPPRVELRDGYALVEAIPQPDFRTEVLLVFWTIQMGVGSLAERFPGNVQVEEVLRV